MKTVLALVLGVWLAGTLLLGAVATENFFTIDRLLSSPQSHASFQRDVARMPPGEARVLLRYLSSELNRLYFTIWGSIELGLAVASVLLASVGLKQKKFKIGFTIMLAMVAVMVFYLTPQITQVGRSLDFVLREPPPPGLAEFGALHAAYSTLDLVKLLIGVWLATALSRAEKTVA